MHPHLLLVLALSVSQAFAQTKTTEQPTPQPAPGVAWNPVADRNARFDAIPDSQRAWPIYARMHAMLAPHARSLQSIQTATPESENWQQAVELLDNTPDFLTLAEQLQDHPDLGWPWTDALPAGWVHTVQGPDATVDDPSPDPVLTELLLPYVGTIRNAAIYLRLEASRAAEQGNTERAVEILEMLPLMITHLAETRVTSTAVGAIAVQSVATVEGVKQLTSLYGDTLSTEHLDRLDALLDTITHQKYTPDIIADEEILFADALDNIYSELDPVGDPQISVRGAGMLMEMAGSSLPPDLDPSSTIPDETKQAAIERFRDATLSYDESTIAWQRAWEATAAEAREPIWTWTDRPALAMLREESLTARDSGKALPHLLFVRSFGQIAEFCELLRMQTDAARIGIALQRYHNQNDSWPDTLDALLPDILDTIPADWIDGQPFRYRLNPDARPTVYSIGPDGDDDDAKPLSHRASERYVYPSQRQANPDAIHDGDWLLWP